MTKSYVPRPLFDTLAFVEDQFRASQSGNPEIVINSWLKQCLSHQISLKSYFCKEYQLILSFLYSYRGSIDTFNSYRRELERLAQWSWFMKEKPLLQLDRLEIEEFIEFSKKPSKRWVGLKTVARFINKDGLRAPNPDWRPFIVKVSKKGFQDGDRPEKLNFKLSQEGIKQIFAITSSFYNYLVQEEIISKNPVAQIRQKSKFLQKKQQSKQIRRLSELQWQTVLNAANELAAESPGQHERTLFIISILYGMYLRISELANTPRWTPEMQHFFKDANGDWWFKTVGKGNKMRQIAVSPAVLSALKRYRKHLNLTPLPSPNEKAPLIGNAYGGLQGIESTRHIRKIVQSCFDKAIEDLKAQNSPEEAEMLRSATVHWLRHTGISDDVKIRPREHVRDDAGHSSSAITDRYVDVELKERARSAKRKSFATGIA